MNPGRGQAAWIGLALVIGIGIGALAVTLPGRARPAPILISTPAPTEMPAPTETPGPVRVYVSGEVLRPKVYELPKNSIVEDAVEAAGGFTAAADREAVNLALALSEGMHVHVPALGEEMPGPTVSGGSGEAPATAGGAININTATVDELEQLPGIGPITAQKIVEYREANGPFIIIDDVMNVSGIGPGKFEQIKELISVE